MYRQLFILLFAALIALQGKANQVDSTSISFKNTTVDFHSIYEADGGITVDFEYSNSGNYPLKINRILAPGIKTIDYPKKSIMPGESGSIKVKVEPFGSPGHYEKDIIVFSNASNSPSQLKIKGKIISGTYNSSFSTQIGGLALKHQQMNFGYIFNGDIIVRYIPVKNTSEEELKIEFSDLPNHLIINNKFIALPAGETGLVEFTYNTNKVDNWDFVIDKIDVHVIGAKTETGSLMVSANIRENFALLSAEENTSKPKVFIPVKVHNYDTIAHNEKVEIKFPIYNQGTRDLIIRCVKPTCGCTAAMPDKQIIAPGDSTNIIVEFNSTGFSGQNKKGVTLITNDPVNYKQFLWITGYIE